jgi:hypothetical protein
VESVAVSAASVVRNETHATQGTRRVLTGHRVLETLTGYSIAPRRSRRGLLVRPWSRFPRYLCVCLRSPLRRGCLLVEARAVHHTVLRAVNHTEALQRGDDPWQTHTPCIISATTSMRYPRPPENRPTADGPAPMWASPGADVDRAVPQASSICCSRTRHAVTGYTCTCDVPCAACNVSHAAPCSTCFSNATAADMRRSAQARRRECARE